MTQKFSAFNAKTLLSQMSSLVGLDAAGTANAKLAIAAIIAAGSAIVGVQQIAATSTYTPTAGAKSALILACGGGGGGGGVGTVAADVNVLRSGSPGGAAELRAFVIQNLLASYTATIGVGGTGGVGATPTNGAAGLATKLNDGSTDILICAGGSGGTTNTGNQAAPTSGANGTGGTGGVSLTQFVPAVSSVNLPSLTGATMGAAPFNYIFGSTPRAISILDVVAGAVTVVTSRAGAGQLGRGSGGTAAMHYNTSTAAADGSAGTSGVMLIIEFG